MGDQLSESLKRTETILKNLTVAAGLSGAVPIGFKLGSKQTATFNKWRHAWSVTVDSASVADVAFRAPLTYCSVVRRQYELSSKWNSNRIAYFFFLAESAVVNEFYGVEGVRRAVERRRSSAVPEGCEGDDTWAAVRGARVATAAVVALGWDFFREGGVTATVTDVPASAEEICALVASLGLR